MLQVVDIRRQANEALQQAQAEITEAEQAAANAHQQVLGEPMLFPLSMHHAFSNCRDRVTIMQHMQCNACIYTNAIKCPDTKECDTDHCTGTSKHSNITEIGNDI